MNVMNAMDNFFSHSRPGKVIDHQKDLQLWKEQSRLKTRDEMISLSQEARETLSHMRKGSRATDPQTSRFDPKALLIKTIIAAFIEKTVKDLRAKEFGGTNKDITDPAAPLPDQARENVQLIGPNLSLDAHYLFAEMETISFTLNGVVKTADGQEISFELELNIEKTMLFEKNFSIRTGDGDSTEPTIVHFSGTAAQLTNFSFEFEFESNDTNGQSFRRPGWGHVRFGAELKQLYNTFSSVMRKMKQAVLGSLADSHEKTPGESMGLQGVQLPFQVNNFQLDMETIMMKSSIYTYNDGNAGSIPRINLAL